MSSAYTGNSVPDGVAADCFYEKASSVPHLLSLLKNNQLLAQTA
jgi:hypothetical protein